jgi:serine/threonine-protein kinase
MHGPDEDLEELLDRGLSSAFHARPGDAPHPSAVEEPQRPEPIPAQVGRFHVVKVLARGGVGIVVKAHDPELGRDIAIKILQERRTQDAEILRMFRDEARIISQLQHPGIVPLHELGQLDDGRPFYTMKVVEGETLHALLERGGTRRSSDFLGIFESICQTMGFAHSRGVVHGDLKPANIMVGAFGEVQILDWGFARSAAAATPPGAPRIAGTPGYMAPELARGAGDRIDARADVFALGSILCEILTGRPAYGGGTRSEIYLRATRAWLDDAWGRLDACGAEQELVALARRCLMVDPGARFADAGEVAAAILRYRTSVEERSHRHELEAAEARAKAAAQARARRLTVALATTVVASVLAGGGAWLAWQRAEDARASDAERSLTWTIGKARLLRSQAQQAGGQDPGPWNQALAAIREAEAFAASPHVSPGLRTQALTLATEIGREMDTAVRNERARHWLEEIRPHFGDDRGDERVEADFVAFFQSFGVDVDGGDLIAAASRVRANAHWQQIADALHVWAHIRRRAGAPAPDAWRRPIALADLVDTDSWRAELRRHCCNHDVKELRALAEPRRLDDLPSESLSLLGECLAQSGELEAAIDLYRIAHLRHPGDFRVSHDLASYLYLRPEPPREEIARLLTAAAACRPKSAHALVDLSLALAELGRGREGLVVAEQARAIEPGYPRLWTALSALRGLTGDVAGAVEAGREAVRLRGHHAPSRLVLVEQLLHSGAVDEALRECREAVRLQPRSTVGQGLLGGLLTELGYLRDAVATLRSAVAMPGADGLTWYRLGLALQRAGLVEDAIAAYQKSLALQPGYAEAQCNLGLSLGQVGRFAEAVAALRKGHVLGKQRADWSYPTDTWVRQAQQTLDSQPDVQRYLDGHLVLDDAAHCTTFAEILQCKGMPLEAARLYQKAFETEDLVPAEVLFAAARSAVAASAAGPEAGAWREKALAWLRRGLELLEQEVEQGLVVHQERAALERLLIDPALARVREPAGLQALDEAGRKAWVACWAQVRTRLGRDGK